MTSKRESHLMRVGSFYRDRLVLAFLALMGLLCLTHIPQKSIPHGLARFHNEKVTHIAAYAMLTALFILAIRPPRRWISYVTLLAVLVVVTALDERTQAYFGRAASGIDWAANIVGVLATMVISLLLRRKTLAKEAQPEETDKQVPSRSSADSQETKLLKVI